MGQLLIQDVACPWGNNWWHSFYDLEKYHKIMFWGSDKYVEENPGYRLEPMEFKKWVTSELQGEVVMREEGRGSGFTYHYAYILLDEDYVMFKLSKWYKILAKYN